MSPTSTSQATTKTVGIIGAGPAGLTAAYQLVKRGYNVTVFEAGDAVGGMAKTIPLWGQLVDLGPHRFLSTDPRVNAIWLEAIGDDYEILNRMTRIYYRGNLIDYPLKPFNALRHLGWFEALRCLASYAKALLFPRRDTTTFESWVSNRFGSRLFSIFFKSYSEKLWGISCQELDSDFAAQRIKKFSLLEAIRVAVGKARSTRHKTLAEQFPYPKLGSGLVYERMAQSISGNGGTVLLNTPVRAVHPRSGETGSMRIELTNGETIQFDHVISSMPITQLVEKLDAPPAIQEHARQLRFRNTILVYLRIESAALFPDQWIYVHSPEVRTGRITNFRNWTSKITGGQPETILCLEYWCSDNDELWRADEAALAKLAMDDLLRFAFLKGARVKDSTVRRVPKCYPVYVRGYKTHVTALAEFLNGVEGLTVIGRYGSFKYNNQDHSILMGALAAENIADGARHDLWQLNTDYEYQEASRIEATGLSRPENSCQS